MTIINYLLTHRKRPKLFSIDFIKTWGKRVFCFPDLCLIILRRFKLQLKGAEVGHLTLVAPCKMNGNARRLKIGSMSSIGRVTLMLHADIVIGDYVVINDAATLLTASHRVDSPYWEQFASPIIIEDFVWIATGATILPGVRIGKGAVVGAGAVVARDVPEYGIVVGNPATLKNKKRCMNLHYYPVHLIACFESWLGH